MTVYVLLRWWEDGAAEVVGVCATPEAAAEGERADRASRYVRPDGWQTEEHEVRG